MKKIAAASLLFLSVLSVGNFASADTWVNGYFRSDGTYVDGHFRSDSDGYFYNNYSTYGNTNPYTGERGYKTYDYSSSYESYDSSYDSYDSGYDDYSNDYDYTSYDSSYDSYDDDYYYSNDDDSYDSGTSFWSWLMGY